MNVRIIDNAEVALKHILISVRVSRFCQELRRHRLALYIGKDLAIKHWG